MPTKSAFKKVEVQTEPIILTDQYVWSFSKYEVTYSLYFLTTASQNEWVGLSQLLLSEANLIII
mgnify:CR=1 FL=1